MQHGSRFGTFGVMQKSKSPVKRFLGNKVIQFTLGMAIVLGALFCVFTPDLFLFKRGANFIVQIMLAYLCLGMIFLILDQKKLMFTALLSCALLCMYLKSTSDQSIRFPSQNTNAQLSVAHINLSLSDDYAATMHTILTTDVDLISFQEYTPDWDGYLTEKLVDRYPYYSSMVRIDPYGMAIFSKYPLSDFDTVLHHDIPNLHALVDVDKDVRIHVFSARTVPPVNFEAYAVIRDHFKTMGRYLSGLSGPVITLGDFSLPSWSQEIKEFKALAHLHDSRRDIVPASLQGSLSLLKIPIDHIFYSGDIECTAFQVLSDATSSHLGILGKYQMKEFASLTSSQQ